MILYFYVLKEHIAPFFFSLGIITFLFVIDFLVKLLDAILSKGLDVLVILEIFVLNLAWMLALSIPMSCLVASLMAFGRLSSDNEIVAVRANGISPLRLIFPVFISSVAICCALIYFNNYILPESNHRAASLRNDISRKNAPAFLTSGILIKDFPNYRIWNDSIDYRTSRLFGVKIYGWEHRQPPRYMYAAEAGIEYVNNGKIILIHLIDGENHVVDDKDPNRYLRLKFNRQTLAVENVDASLIRRDRSMKTDREMSVSEMYAVVKGAYAQTVKYKKEYPGKIFADFLELDTLLTSDTTVTVPPRLKEKEWWEQFPVGRIFYKRLNNMESEKQRLIGRFNQRIEAEEKQASKFLVEIHKKFSIPVACIVFVLVGGPLGILAKRGGIGMGSILSSGFFLIYWVCLLRGEAMADRLIISPWLSMWFPNIIVGIVSLFLVRRCVKMIR